MRNKKGFSLIEAIVSILIIAIIAGVTSAIFIYLAQVISYTPSEMKARAVAQEVLDIMVEGESGIRGIRYANQILEAENNKFTYTFGYPGNADKRNVMLLYNNVFQNIQRSYSSFGDLTNPPQQPAITVAEPIPYYAKGDINIRPANNVPALFRYYKQDGSLWVSGTDPLYEIRRLDISVEVRTGSGSFEAWQGSYKTTTSVEIKQFI